MPRSLCAWHADLRKADDMAMNLTQQQQDILNGSRGETLAKVWKTLVMYGETFGAQKMVPVTSGMATL